MQPLMLLDSFVLMYFPTLFSDFRRKISGKCCLSESTILGKNNSILGHSTKTFGLRESKIRQIEPFWSRCRTIDIYLPRLQAMGVVYKEQFLDSWNFFIWENLKSKYLQPIFLLSVVCPTSNFVQLLAVVVGSMCLLYYPPRFVPNHNRKCPIRGI